MPRRSSYRNIIERNLRAPGEHDPLSRQRGADDRLSTVRVDPKGRQAVVVHRVVCCHVCHDTESLDFLPFADDAARLTYSEPRDDSIRRIGQSEIEFKLEL